MTLALVRLVREKLVSVIRLASASLAFDRFVFERCGEVMCAEVH